MYDAMPLLSVSISQQSKGRKDTQRVAGDSSTHPPISPGE